ncbi:adaptor protein MecA [Bacillaceae bacterium Marseille-Q3522]|nr:adaptor protein MecA [Bacillaceae bacterium Marseille-Q3522]
MRLERLNNNKIKIFLTLDDLFERGLTKEDIWKDSLKWQQLFHDMLDQANETFGVDFHGSVAVEIFSMQAQGMVMIVTMEELEDEPLLDTFLDIKMNRTTVDIVFEFPDFEDVVQLCYCFSAGCYPNASLYFYHNQYYVQLQNVETDMEQQLVSVMEEYGHSSFVSIHLLKEYGKEIIKDNMVEVIQHYFPL